MKSAPQENEPDALDILARLDWARNPGFLIYDVQRLVAQVVDERMRSVGLTNAQLRAILHLNHQEGVSQVHLSEEMGIKKASLGVLLERLEEKDLVLRRADPNDRRANLIYLSDKAKGLLEPIYENGAAVMNDLMAGLNTAEQKQLVSLLLRIKTNAQNLSQNSATNGSAK
ncbi:MAG: MarR family transcriptional regulator [Rhodospirillaceae bacterium]|jgi:DNA-binding MarR family transcriptional regulator|nr:MarR family transcriptional regulator [Rhodospirillaceae bacterium]MBT4045699.1 MarR family transcriptional regulator [Rhodospirillaceae bacterium]MBT4689096.1 MarR family transcriptional regulator [Rhodospirillaceae bacterium]MBT5082079.1 MarR family transcriptional regulator [Rhodospirillaceae bacterium]MBT5523552.1 MarR family transcriptional regulator [Rhodospirillaceae bacterium]